MIRTKILTTVIAVGLGAGLLLADAKPTREDEKAIQQLFSTLVATWNAHDMKAHCAVIAPDADFVNVNGWWWRGRDEIERQHSTAHQTVFKTTEAMISPKKIRMLKPDVAIVQASWRVSGDVRSKDPRDYMMTYVLRKRGREWFIIAAQNASAEDRSTSAHPLNVSLATPASFAGSDNRTENVGSPEQVAITNALAQANAAWSNGDMKAAAQIYTADADVVDAKARWFKGNASIQQHLTALRSESTATSKRKSDVLKVRLLDPDTAVVNERWYVTGGEQNTAISGMGLLVMTAQQGTWRIIAAENTITRGTAPAAPK